MLEFLNDYFRLIFLNHKHIFAVLVLLITVATGMTLEHILIWPLKKLLARTGLAH